MDEEQKKFGQFRDEEYQAHYEKQVTSGWFSFLWETIRIVIISLAIILPVKYYLVQPFFVNGASMEPNFHDKDYIFVDKLSYRMHSPLRGDVIIFRYPRDPQEYFIKRVVGLPGETIEIEEGRISIVNDTHPEGFTLEESQYLPANLETSGPMHIKLSGTEYFVLGDNRGHSSDSRVWGPLDRSFISGRAFIRLWPLEDIGLVGSATYPVVATTP